MLGSFGPVAVRVPRARLAQADGGTREWRGAALPRYARMTGQVEALIASTCLAGPNTRRVGRAPSALFRGAVGKDVVSRTWRRGKADRDTWNGRSLAGEDIVRLILDDTAFTRLPRSQWKSARTTNAIERLHEEFKRRIKTRTVPPSAETAAMLFWALLASSQITMRKVDGWQSLAEPPARQIPIDLAA